jgi:hypothetical protein
MIKPLHKFVNWQLTSGQLDHWTAYHLAGGAFICKVSLWLGASDFMAVMVVFGLGLLWEVAEYFIEGTEEVYGTKKIEQPFWMTISKSASTSNGWDRLLFWLGCWFMVIGILSVGLKHSKMEWQNRIPRLLSWFLNI